MVRPQTLAGQVYEHLLRRIHGGDLGPGSPLIEGDLAARLGVSRTPVREALGRLAQYGVVESRPNHGAIVRRLGRAELLHLYQVREALEVMAVELACGRLTEADFERLDALSRAARDDRAAGYLKAFDEFDVGLHQLIAERSGNPILVLEIGKLLDLTMMIHDQLETVLIDLKRIDPGEQKKIRRMCCLQHDAIIDALRLGRPAACRRAIATHLRDAARYKARLMPSAPPTAPVGANGAGRAH